MRTTVDLPEGLVRAVRARAAQTGRSFKEVLRQVVAAGLASAPAPRQESALRPPVRLPGGPLTIDDLEAAIADRGPERGGG